ncbi:MAG TPA: hypothetical protein VH134_06985 [Candidatus Dormibacteraeota bacterium]|jgi:hypothetical protein|nr:hypothetical protein [Candidatus Dormibacteraeota bacterium]
MPPRLLIRLAPLAALGGLVATGCGSAGTAPSASTAAGSPAAVTSATPAAGTVLSSPPGAGAPTPAVEVNPPGDIPDNQVYITFTPAAGGYSAAVPEGWARVDAGSATSFTDHYNGIRLETVAAASAPTVDSATATEVPAIRRQHPDMSDLRVTPVTRTVGDGVLITYQTYSAPNPVTGRVARVAVERYEFWRAGTEAILTLSGPVGADNVDPWKKVSSGFRWL